MRHVVIPRACLFLFGYAGACLRMSLKHWSSFQLNLTSETLRSGYGECSSLQRQSGSTLKYITTSGWESVKLMLSYFGAE